MVGSKKSFIPLEKKSVADTGVLKAKLDILLLYATTENVIIFSPLGNISCLEKHKTVTNMLYITFLTVISIARILVLFFFK